MQPTSIQLLTGECLGFPDTASEGGDDSESPDASADSSPTQEEKEAERKLQKEKRVEVGLNVAHWDILLVVVGVAADYLLYSVKEKRDESLRSDDDFRFFRGCYHDRYRQ